MRISEVMDKNERMLGLKDEIKELTKTAQKIRKRKEWDKVERLKKQVQRAGRKAVGP